MCFVLEAWAEETLDPVHAYALVLLASTLNPDLSEFRDRLGAALSAEELQRARRLAAPTGARTAH